MPIDAGRAEVDIRVATLAMTFPNDARKTSRLIGLRKYLHFVKVIWINREPMTLMTLVVREDIATALS